MLLAHGMVLKYNKGLRFSRSAAETRVVAFYYGDPMYQLSLALLLFATAALGQIVEDDEFSDPVPEPSVKEEPAPSQPSKAAKNQAKKEPKGHKGTVKAVAEPKAAAGSTTSEPAPTAPKGTSATPVVAPTQTTGEPGTDPLLPVTQDDLGAAPEDEPTATNSRDLVAYRTPKPVFEPFLGLGLYHDATWFLALETSSALGLELLARPLTFANRAAFEFVEDYAVGLGATALLSELEDFELSIKFLLFYTHDVIENAPGLEIELAPSLRHQLSERVSVFGDLSLLEYHFLDLGNLRRYDIRLLGASLGLIWYFL
ncbi:MAG: hypothetical protein A2284_09790 [Deltaproteobacteria bacterium RIFOXYA12_FULL_61_11]|nr:MAG: hypothetical protein A2284_09790 [Deltaproteobacteria bacterium RIFOXYA12_FULL_61_11]